jgi:hypothetical protein
MADDDRGACCLALAGTSSCVIGVTLWTVMGTRWKPGGSGLTLAVVGPVGLEPNVRCERSGRRLLIGPLRSVVDSDRVATGDLVQKLHT